MRWVQWTDFLALGMSKILLINEDFMLDTRSTEYTWREFDMFKALEQLTANKMWCAKNRI